MARLRSLEEGNARLAPHKTEVDCAWQIIEAPRGRVLQLSTYGSDERASEPKVSQTIQLDETIARRLVVILRLAFPSISDK
jgi:hypothetical protein